MHSPRQNHWLPAIITLGLAQTTAHAIVIPDYDDSVNARFSSGFLDQPVGNTSSAYLGAGYDFSGVGWVPGTGLDVPDPDRTRVRNATLLTPLHLLMANHYTVGNGTTYLFLNPQDTLHANTLLKTASVTTGAFSNDLAVGTLANTLASDTKIAPYRVLDVRDGSLSGQPMVIYGSNSDNLGPRIGLGTGITRSGNAYQSWEPASGPGSASYWEFGDSGSPAFVPYGAPGGGATSLTLVGPAYFARDPSTLLPRYTQNFYPDAGVNNVVKLDGYAVKWTLYDNPSDTAHTLQQWTGATGATLSTAANWSMSLAPAGTSVLFDADTAIGSTTLTLDAAVSLRGALFKASSSSAGFTFDGTAPLTLGTTGLRNESSSAQTFNVPIILSDSQNWEAAAGNLVFNNTVDTTAAAHLVVIGGDHDTTLNGALSGAGALAKDDAGVLTLNAANTYVGKTWIHGGTLRLGTGALPSGTELVFQTTNPAALDLNGNNQTVAGLVSAYGGTGQVRLGGATLTVNNTAANTFAGSITGAGGLAKTGAGVLALTGANTYAGATTIGAGALRIGSADALSAGTNVILSGGVLEFGAADYSGSLGTGAGQVRFAGSGGFSAFGANRSVNLGGSAVPATLAWGAADFVPAGASLILSSNASDSTIELRNPIVLATAGAGSRTIQVDNGSAAVDARLGGSLSASGSTYGLIKTGAGTLELTGANTYAGTTVISAGALRVGTTAALSGSSNVVLTGGVLELAAGDYTASLGSGPGQLRFNGGGGFSAAGAARTVNLGGQAAPLTWGAGSFVGSGSLLVLSSAGSDATVTLVNPLNLGTGTGSRIVQVDNGSAAIDARLAGNITDDGTFTLVKTGAGTLELTGANHWQGTTTVLGGVLRLGSAAAIPNGNLALSGGVLELAAGDYTASLGTGAGQVRLPAGSGFSAAGADRIVNLGGAGAALAWNAPGFLPSGNSLWLSSSSADATLIFQNALVLGTSGSGTRNILVNDGSASIDGRITGNISSPGGAFGLSKSGSGTLELSGVNTYTGATTITGGALRFASSSALPSTSNLVLAGGVLELSGGDYAATIGTGAGQIRFAGDGGFSAVGATRSVTLNGGAPILWGSTISNLSTLLLSSSGADATVDFKNPLVLANTGSVLRTVQVNNGSAAVDARLSGAISELNGTFGLNKTGAGTLELAGANTYRQTTLVSAGTLLINGDHSGARGDVVVASGATLGGSGRIGGATFVHAGGTLALGATSRLLTFDSTLRLDAGSVFVVTLDNGGAGAIAGINYDHVSVAGATALNGAELSLNLSPGFVDTARQGTVFTLLSSDELLGTLAQGGSTESSVNGVRYQFGISYTDGALLLTLENIGAIPEPGASAMLTAFAAAGFTFLRSRRRRPRRSSAPSRPKITNHAAADAAREGSGRSAA